MTNLAAAVELKWYENQDWTGLSGAQAFQIIERHAEGWTEIDEAMAAWLKANQRPPVAGLAELTDCELIGEVRENGVIWFKHNPHACPIGTKFYAREFLGKVE